MRSSGDWDNIVKELKPGEHNHGGTAHAHPIDKPHRPGTQQEQWHLTHGLTNNWYKLHGTTREEWLKENPDGVPQKKKPKDKQDTTDPKDRVLSDDTLRSPVKWKAVAEQRKQFETLYKNTDELYDDWHDRIRSLDAKPSEKLFMVAERLAKLNGDNLVDSRIRNAEKLDRVDEETALAFIDSILDCTMLTPIAGFSLSRIKLQESKKSTYADYWCVENGYRYYMQATLDKGVENIEEPTKNIIDPVTNEPDSRWNWHNTGSTTANVMTHEYGHGIDSQIGMMFWSAEYKFGKNMTEDMQGTLEVLGVEDAEITDSEGKVLSIFKDMVGGYDTLVYETYLSFKEYGDCTYKNTTMMAEQISRTEGVVATAKKLYGTWAVVIEPLPHILSKFYDPQYDSQSVMKGATVQEEMTVQRVRECEELYKKIYKQKRIKPSEVYSQYAYYGPGKNQYERGNRGEALTTDIEGQRYYYMRKSRVTVRDSQERIAEAYSDVIIRKDRANSMSQLLVAHTFYEVAQITEGYSGSFEDYINDYIGMGTFKERITKSRGNPYYDILRALKPRAKYHGHVIYNNGVPVGVSKSIPNALLDEMKDDIAKVGNVPTWYAYVEYHPITGQPIGLKKSAGEHIRRAYIEDRRRFGNYSEYYRPLKKH